MIRPPTDFDDTFDPRFDLGTNDNAEWVAAAIAEFDAVLVRFF